MKNKILLGFEIGTGGPVHISPSHLIVTGVTALSGKTTTLEALIKRSDKKAIVFKTKIGERAFYEGTIIPPYFKEKSDWQYIQSLLEATLRERLKFERSWIIRACKGTSSLFDVKKNIDEILTNGKLRGMDRDMFTNLQAYLEIVLPQLQYANFSHSLVVNEGINIMDLERFKEEIQSLVIRSTLETVLTELHDIITIIPEAWKFCPEKRGNPVKPAAESLIRQGATNGNYLFLDSQDLAGVDKVPLKQVSTWILGLQMERNEVVHTLDQINVPKKQKPKVDEIMSLSLGHFVLVTPKMTKKVYVQPIWMDEVMAISIAKGETKVEEIQKPDRMGPSLSPQAIRATEKPPMVQSGGGITKDQLTRIQKDIIQLREDVFNKFAVIGEEIRGIRSNINAPLAAPMPQEIDVGDIVSRVLAKMPVTTGGTIKIEPKEAVLKQFQQVEVDRILKRAESLTPWQKQVLKFVEAKGNQTPKAELLSRILGKSSSQLGGTYKNLYKEADDLAEIGFLRADSQGRFYPNLAENVRTQLATYNATDQDVEEVVGGILAKLK